MFNLFNCGDCFCKMCNTSSPTCIRGATGPTGARGFAGPAGATGASGENLFLGGLQVALSTTETITLGEGETLKFNSTMTNNSNKVEHTSLDTFTIMENGYYIIAWQILCGGSTIAPVPTFALEFGDGGKLYSSSTINSQQMNSTNFVKIANAPVTVKLVNATGNDVFIDANVSSATMVFIHLQNT